jgi:hypothetical protein
MALEAAKKAAGKAFWGQITSAYARRFPLQLGSFRSGSREGEFVKLGTVMELARMHFRSFLFRRVIRKS